MVDNIAISIDSEKRHDGVLGFVLTLLGGISKMRGEGIITVSLQSHIFSLPSLHEVSVYCILMKNENGKHHVAYTYICGPL